MEKEFIPYEQALALKELGFDESCLNLYHKDTHQLIYKPIDGVVMIKIDNHNKTNHCSTPTFSQAFRWFREKYRLELLIAKDDIEQYYFSVKKSEALFDEDDYCFETYEKAELECLNKLIEIIKNK
jgi:hypothetical protein